MKLLILIYNMYGLTPLQIFKCAYDYYEVPYNDERIEKEFHLCFGTSKGRVIMTNIPLVVKDFCLAIMLDKVELPTKQEMLAM